MENRNLILAIILSVIILFGSEMLFNKQRPTPPAQTQQTTQQVAPQTTPGDNAIQAPNIPASSPMAPAVAPAATAAMPQQAPDRNAMLAAGRNMRVQIETPRLRGSIALQGARLDDLVFTDYRETLDKNSDNIVLLSPSGSANPYFADHGWVANGVNVPTGQSIWQADRATLRPGEPVTLRWDNQRGLVFKRTYAIDENFMFTVTQTVENNTDAPVTLNPYGLIARTNTPKLTGFFILHEGLLGVFDDTLKEVDYDEIADEREMKQTGIGGWIGITDKYWLTALVPSKAGASTTRFVYRNENGQDKYQTDYLGDAITIQPRTAGANESLLFTGAKEVNLLDSYEQTHGVARFDLAIDFGWFYFLTKPIFHGLVWINAHVGNFGVAILLLTVVIKLAFFPLANKSYRAMSKMKKLQPEMKKLQEQFKEDKLRLNQEMMALYKREKANPAAGCLPMLVQIPVFFALYKVLFVTIEMRHAPFFGWIKDLSAPDPTSIFTLFGLFPWDLPQFLMIGIWPIIMGVTMWLQQRLNPQPTDPVQAKIFLFLPIMFTFLLGSFPAGLVIYWAWNNALSIAQQWVIMRRMGVKI